MAVSSVAVSSLVAGHARSAAGRLAVLRGEQVVSYAELDERAATAAAALSARGVVAGTRCVLLLGDPLALLVALLGCDRLGATAVVLDPAWPPALRSAALRVVGSTVLVDRAPDEGDADEATRAAPDVVLGHADTRFLAAFTSGSTGAPRAVVRSRGSWTASFAPFTDLTGIGAASVVLVPGPLHSTLFLFGALHALAVGAVILLEPPATSFPYDDLPLR
jgi:long-chain acyl-CoA synthetase